MANMANTETIAITLQKICNGFPLIFKTLAERHGLFGSPSNWRHTTTDRSTNVVEEVYPRRRDN
jgi:hypothetical protein